ncbi:10595_t:CDS:2, partial [Dentiscutata erythropus]
IKRTGITSVILNCLVFGEDPYDEIFSVEISTSKNVYALKKAINDKLKSDVVTKKLKLFKVNISLGETRDENIVQMLDLSIGQEMNNFQKISDYFSAQPVDTNLHILVQLPIVATGTIRARSFSLESNINEKRLKCEKEYNDTVARGLEAISPSVRSKPSEFFRSQQSCPILNGRPFENTSPPITLYHIIFSQFLGDLSNANIEIPSDFLLWIDDFIYAAIDSYFEEERNQKMRSLFSDKLGTVLVIEYGQGREYSKERTRLEQVEVTPLYKERYILEIIGLSQMLAKSENAAVLRPSSSPLPAHGPAVNGLHSSHDKSTNSRSSQSNCLPFLCIACCFSTASVFLSKSELGSIRSTIFSLYLRKAKTDDNHMIVVKFAPKYNFEAHNIYALQDYTPKLLYCSNDEEAKTLGGHKMIIIEYVDSTSLDQKHEINPVFWEAIFNDVEAAI